MSKNAVLIDQLRWLILDQFMKVFTIYLHFLNDGFLFFNDIYCSTSDIFSVCNFLLNTIIKYVYHVAAFERTS